MTQDNFRTTLNINKSVVSTSKGGGVHHSIKSYLLVDMVLSQTQDTVQALKHRGYDAYYKRKVPYPFDYACPSAVYAGKTENQGITEICCAWGDAVTEV